MQSQNESDGPFHILKIQKDTPWEVEMKMLPVAVFNFTARQSTYKEVKASLVLIYYCYPAGLN
jgi:hypothetical protein